MGFFFSPDHLWNTFVQLFSLSFESNFFSCLFTPENANRRYWSEGGDCRGPKLLPEATFWNQGFYQGVCIFSFFYQSGVFSVNWKFAQGDGKTSESFVWFSELCFGGRMVFKIGVLLVSCENVFLIRVKQKTRLEWFQCTGFSNITVRTDGKGKSERNQAMLAFLRVWNRTCQCTAVF